MFFRIKVTSLPLLLFALCDIFAVVKNEKPEEQSSQSCFGGVCDNPDEELRSMRLEYIKSQILQKLRLKSPPKITRPSLPELLNLELSTEIEEDPEMNFTREDFYGKIHEVIIFPNQSYNTLRRYDAKANSFRFHLTQDLSTRNVASAELWVYCKNHSNSTAYKILEYLDEVDQDYKRDITTEMIDAPSQSEWLKFNLTFAVREWLQRKLLVRNLEIILENELNTSQQKQKEPFLVIRTRSQISSESSRRKRNVICTPETTVCCRQYFNVSFSDIGWHHWIIKPDSYNANYCKGKCIADISASRYFHTTILQEYLQSDATTKRNTTLSLCCSPARMKSLTIIYMTEERLIYKKTLPNMIAETCDCA